MNWSDGEDTTKRSDAEENFMDTSPLLKDQPHDMDTSHPSGDQPDEMDTSHSSEDQPDENQTSEMTENELLSANYWLTDRDVSKAQSILQKQYPQQNGLQDCCQLFYYRKWNSQPKDFIEIINAERHWVCASNIFCPQGVVDVYDSSPCPSDNRTLRKQLAIILNDPSHSFRRKYPWVQSQIGDSDCGLFAIAFAIALCNRDDPSHLTFDQVKMRPHLVECFATGKMTPFPPANGPQNQ